MASLIEELITELNAEQEVYAALLEISDTKREAIIHGPIEKLEAITAKEEETSSELKAFEKKRVRILSDMAVVLGHEGEKFTVTNVIDCLGNQPEEQDALIAARDTLIQTASQLHLRNQQNYILLQQSLEMVDFDLTLFRSLKQAPETANYDKNAANTGDLLGGGSFDTSQ